MSEKTPTFRLFSMPSYAEGFGSIINLGGYDHFYNFNDSPEEADFYALLSDWKAIGMDIEEALKHERVGHFR